MLSQKFDIIAELGARNSVSYDLVMARFESIQQTLLQRDKCAHFNTPYQKESGPAHASAAGASCSDATSGSQEENPSPTDNTSLRAILQFSFRPGPRPTQDNMRDATWWKGLLGQFIAVKYAAKRQVSCVKIIFSMAMSLFYLFCRVDGMVERFTKLVSLMGPLGSSTSLLMKKMDRTCQLGRLVYSLRKRPHVTMTEVTKKTSLLWTSII